MVLYEYSFAMRLIVLSFFVFFPPLTLSCWESAGEEFGVDPFMLYSLAVVESSLNDGALNINGDSNYDVGIMQINSFWFDHLHEIGLEKKDLWDRCSNIRAGAWILRKNVDQYGNKWRAIGSYHVGNSKNSSAERRRKNYVKKVSSVYFSIVNSGV